ncbi:MAG: methyltransferase domain-containing protein [Haloarculaceae archaeon]
MLNVLRTALSDPWVALRAVLGEPLHPGGAEATADLLDRADVGPGTRLVDLGCGAGGALGLARDRGATAVGLDREPATGDGPPDPYAVRGDLTRLPVADAAVDVALAECVLCLSPDVERSLAEGRRVLADGGRLAISDVVTDGDPPDLPATLAEPLCLTGDRERERLLDRIEAAGFTVRETRDHREDLLAMRDRARERVDYERLLPALGERDRRLLDGIHDLEAAIEDGRVGYVSLVADVA